MRMDCNYNTQHVLPIQLVCIMLKYHRSNQWKHYYTCSLPCSANYCNTLCNMSYSSDRLISAHLYNRGASSSYITNVQWVKLSYHEKWIKQYVTIAFFSRCSQQSFNVWNYNNIGLIYNSMVCCSIRINSAHNAGVKSVNNSAWLYY